ncbi:MAG: FAD/NAD(P)-binding protein [Solirubrobacterales bacterium]|nr:FAD/NAD(P)-binding protein [Solirubrobacterales bacterium]
MLRIAIVGLGPWGVCALERVVTIARQELSPDVDVAVHVIEPGPPGSGVYDTAQPDYLLLNNPCGQLSLYPFETETYQPCYAVGLYDWAVERGYRWVGEECAIDPAGQPIERHHFLPRRLMGEYLQWFYRALIVGAPRNVHIVHHPTSAVDLVARRDGSEEVRLANGRAVAVDHVIVTSGHTANRDLKGLDDIHPYPVTHYVGEIPAGTKVGVSGMGLVAVDVVTALTVGRGGRFIEQGGTLSYRPSGREPEVRLYCRSGLPFTAKSVTEVDRSVVYKPLICTPEALDALSGRSNGHRRQVDVRTELLPLMFAEMHARYYAQMAFQGSGSRAEGAAVRARLRAAWVEDRFEGELARLASRFGSFDPEALFFGRAESYDSAEDYERSVYQGLADDLRAAEVPNGASPVKSATEVFRIFRDPIRSVVELGGLSLASYMDFNANICSRIHRLVAGPPALRSRQMLALMDSGVVRAPYGPAPARALAADTAAAGASRTRISSRALGEPYTDDVDVVIRGHLEDPRLAGSASELLTRLYNRGRVTQFQYADIAVGSVNLTADSHPIDRHGRPQSSVSMFGVLTEGVRHFTAYIPSPRSRMRAVEDIGACVTEFLAGASVRERLAA